MRWSRARSILAMVWVCSMLIAFGPTSAADARKATVPPPTDTLTLSAALAPFASVAQQGAAVGRVAYTDAQGDSGWAYDLKELEVGYDPTETSFNFWLHFYDPYYGVTPNDSLIIYMDTDGNTSTGVGWPGDNVGTDYAIVFEGDGSATVAYLLDTPNDDQNQWTLVDYLDGYEDVGAGELFAAVPLGWLDGATSLRMIVESYYEDAEGYDVDWLPETGSRQYRRDVDPPTVSPSRPYYGVTYVESVVPELNVYDTNLASVEATLDGAPYVLTISPTTSSGYVGPAITGVGSHTLVVTATDESLNETVVSVSFKIVADTFPPVIFVDGVVEGGVYAHPVIPAFGAQDHSEMAISATLNGKPFVSGTRLRAARAHILVVTAEDVHGNKAEVTVRFTIVPDTTAPLLEIWNVTDGATYSWPVRPTAYVSDASRSWVSSATLNGQPLQPVTTRDYPGRYYYPAIETNGVYTLVVTAEDEFGNTTTKTVGFTVAIDSIPPQVTVTGVAEGETYRVAVSPEFSASDANLDFVSALLNGQPFLSGQAISAEGSYTLVVRAVDRSANSTTVTIKFTISYKLVREYVILRGTDRYQTALQVSQRAYPGTAPAVLLATGENFPDALCAAPLATAVDGPLLLTPTGSLSVAVKDEILRLQPSKVYVIGLPDGPENALRAALPPGVEIKRIRGTDRYDTAKRVAEELLKLLGPRKKVVIAPGDSFPDALSAAPLAAANGWPILLTPQFSPAVPAPTSAAIKALGATSALVVGTHSDPGIARVKLVGVDRYDTCGKIADYARGFGMSYSHIGLATGQNFPDALAAGPFLAADHGILLLTGTLSVPVSTQSRVGINRAVIEQAVFIGLSDGVINVVKGLMP